MGSWGCAPASLPLDANKPLTFQQVAVLVETRGVPRAHSRAPRDRRPAGEGREELRASRGSGQLRAGGGGGGGQGCPSPAPGPAASPRLHGSGCN